MTLITTQTADTAVFLNPDEGAETVTYNGTDILAALGKEERKADQDGAMVDILPIWVDVADVALPVYRDTVVIRSETWRVQHGFRFDGGMWEIDLKRDERPPM